MKKIIGIVLVTCFIISGCIKTSTFHNTVYDDSNMDEATKTEAAKVVDLVEKYILEGDAEAVVSYLSAELQKDKDGVRQFVLEIQGLEVREHYLLGNHYIESSDTYDNSTVITYPDGASELKMTVPIGAEEEFIRSVVLERDGLDYLMLQIYLKENGAWKLTVLKLVDYGYRGRSPYDLYAQIQTFQKDNDEISMIGYCNILDNIINAQSDMASHSFMEDYQSLKKSLSEMDAEALLENLGKQITDELTIIGMEGMGVKEGTVLMLYALTDKSLDDGTAIDEMNKKAAEDLKEKIPGTIKNFDFIAIRVYNEMPSDPSRTYDFYGSISKVDL